MLNFKYPEIADREWLYPILSSSGRLGSENAFGTLYLWKEIYHSKVCKENGMLFMCSGADQCSYSFPVTENLKEALEILLKDSEEKGIPFKMWGLTLEEVNMVEQVMPNTFVFTEDRDSADYIYTSDSLINLPGRKFHSKRNHLSQFSRLYDFAYEDITKDNLQKCEEIAREWCKQNGNCGENGLDGEFCALRKAWENFDALSLSGGIISIEGKPVAFTIGEEISSREYILHFEKALSGYSGLYAKINNEFAKRHLEKYEYVNREEDMGMEGLRKAKLSYNPEIILLRHVAVLKG